MSRTTSALLVGAGALVIVVLWLARATSERWLGSAETPLAGVGTEALDDEVHAGDLAASAASADTNGARTKARPARPGQGLRIAGTLTRSDDRAPAARARLHVQAGTRSVEVVTDAEGRFETDAVFARGMAQIYHIADAGRAEYARALPVLPAQVALFGHVDQPFELRVPDRELQVMVRENNRPRAGAEVRWRILRGVGAQGYEYASAQALTDRRGLARIGFHGGNLESRLEVSAQAGELCSATVDLHQPWPMAPILLDLVLGGRISVRTVDEARQPLPERRLRLVHKADDANHLAIWTTGADGGYRSELLTPGPYYVQHVDPTTGELRGAHVVVEPGRTAALDLELAHLTLDIAAAGRVVDEQGAGLESVVVALLHPEVGLMEMATDAGGRFEFRAPACDRVRVALDQDPWTDVFDPPHVETRFGHIGLEFARAEPLSFVEIELEIVDAVTGEPIQAEVIVLAHRPPYVQGASRRSVFHGHARLTYPNAADLELRISCVGYRFETRKLGALLDPIDPLRPRHRVELEPGLSMRLRAVAPASAVDFATQVPLSRATVMVAGRVVATADDQGWIDVDLPAWPSEIVLAHEGLSSVALDTDAWIEALEPPTVEMR